MKPLVFTLRTKPDQRLDLSALVPQQLAGKAAADIAWIELQTTRQRVTVGDIFKLRIGDPHHIRFEGGSDRFDQVGQGMMGGEMVVEGNVGIQAGRLMAGGRLTIKGSAGPWAASGMKGGTIDITSAAGDRVGGPLAGEAAGMRGGVVIVRGDGGERIGDRMRRGTIIVEGCAGSHAGSRMIAGTLLVRRKVGPLPGYLMRRGTIVLGEGADRLSPTFVDCGVHDLVATRLMAALLQDSSTRIASLLRRPLRRLAGDMAVLGQGEILLSGD